MSNTLHKQYCPDCKGFGHVPNCKCRDPVAFIVGCCKRCGGEGFIPAETEPEIVDAYGRKEKP